jgi:hypothetical protein
MPRFWLSLLVIAILFAAGGFLVLWFNWLRYGSIWLTGYHLGRPGKQGFSGLMYVGLYGILFSSGRSWFLYSPICLLGVAGFSRFWRHAHAEAALVLGVTVPSLLTFSKYWSWHGGWEWGERFMLFAIPLVMWTSIPVWQWMDNRRKSLIPSFRGVVFALVAGLGVLIQLIGIMIEAPLPWELILNETQVFRYKMYIEDVWEPRDDSTMMHFVPDFSPIATNIWLIRSTWNRNALSDEELSRTAPWYNLNPKWAPTNVRKYLGYDPYVCRIWKRGGLEARTLALLWGLVLTALSFAALLRVRQLCRQTILSSDEQQSD